MVSRTTVIGTAVALLIGSLVATGAPGAHAATVDTSAWYVVVNRNSGKAMDVAGASSADGAAITQWARHDGTNQQFQFVDSGGGYYRLKARHSGKALDVSGWSTADNAAVSQWSDHGGVNQQWQLVRIGTTGSLPSRFQWSSSGPLAGPKPDAQHPGAAAVKDFSVRHSPSTPADCSSSTRASIPPPETSTTCCPTGWACSRRPTHPADPCCGVAGDTGRPAPHRPVPPRGP